MSLLNDASLILTPNAVKEGKLYSIIPSNGNGDMTVVRATATATRTNELGLIEPTPYNLATYSEQISDVSWGKSNLTVTADATISPNGTMSADRLIENTTISQKAVTKAVTTTSGQTVTYSVYLKMNGRSSSAVFVFDSSFVNGFGANFNLSTGVVALNFNQGTSVLSSSSIIDVGNGWYRCSVSGVVGAFTSLQLATYITDGTTSSYLGNGTSGLFMWGAQLVQGSIPKDYFYTTDRLNVPRLNYDSVGGCPSILVEPQRTNLDANSQTFVGWTLTNSAGVTTSAVSATNPYGFGTVQKVIPSAVSGQHRPLLNANYPSNGRIWVIAKADGYNFLSLGDGGGVSGGSIIFNLSNGTISGTQAGYTGFIISLGNGWYKCSINTVNTGLTGKWIVIRNNNTTADYVGDGTSGILIAHKQLEVGEYDTTSILTNGAIATRNADVISKTGISDLIGQTEGVLFVESAALANDLTTRSISISDGTANNRITLSYASVSNLVLLNGTANGVSFASLINYTLPDETQFAKIAIRYRANNITFWVNGVKRGTDITSQVLPINLSRLALDNSIGSFPFFAKINSLQLYKTFLTDAEMTQLTTL